MSILENLTEALGADLRNGVTSEYVQKHVTPPLGVEFAYPIFKKYGYTHSYFGDQWVWNEHELQNAPQTDLWQMMAIASMYWANKYKEWYREVHK